MSLLTLIKSTPSADPSNLKITEIRHEILGGELSYRNKDYLVKISCF